MKSYPKEMTSLADEYALLNVTQKVNVIRFKRNAHTLDWLTFESMRPLVTSINVRYRLFKYGETFNEEQFLQTFPFSFKCQSKQKRLAIFSDQSGGKALA